MTEKQIKELYENEISNSAPDMDKLWSRIENGLAEKPRTEEAGADAAAEKKRHFITLKKGLAFAAACAVLAIVIPTALVNNSKSEIMSSDSSGAYNSIVPAETVKEAPHHAESVQTAPVRHEDAAAAAPVIRDVLDYSELDLAPAHSADISFTGEPNGDEYFCEDDILLETDAFIDAVVSRVYGSADGSCVYYELKAVNVYTPEGEEESGTITVSGCPSAEMFTGREYLIPVKYSGDEISTVYDRVPQIEIARDGTVVYYNGWYSLDSEESGTVLYPSSGIDDFFYDRMKFSYGGYQELVDKWRKLKKT